MADSTSLPSKSVMLAAALVSVAGAGVAGFLAFAPSNKLPAERPVAKAIETPIYTDGSSKVDSGIVDPALSRTASQENDEGGMAEPASRLEAEQQSKERLCFQNLFPINIVQKLNDDDFLAYSRFSVGSLT